MKTKLSSIREAHDNENGFTLVELMIVVVIIGILAAIAIPVFANQQKATYEAEAKSDIKMIQSAIILAQAKTNKTLYQVTGVVMSASECFLTNDPISTSPTSYCWTVYNSVLAKISTASGMDINGLVDPYGRPYSINPNELEANATDCRSDEIGAHKDTWGSALLFVKKLPMVSGACS